MMTNKRLQQRTMTLRIISKRVVFLASVLSVTLTGCVSTGGTPFKVTEEEIEAETEKQTEAALEEWIRKEDRLHRIANNLMVASALLCEDDVVPYVGTYIRDAESLGTLEDEVRDYWGWDEHPVVRYVAPDSPADRAGLQQNDFVISVNDVSINKRLKKEREEGRIINRYDLFNELYLESLKKSKTISLGLLRGSQEVAVSMRPEGETCSYGVELLDMNEMNAFADGDRVLVSRGLMRYVDDNDLAMVLAHEMAHNMTGHIVVKQATAAVGLVLDLGVMALTGNYFSSGTAIGDQIFSESMEEEADRVGLYLMANADLDYRSAVNIWRRLSLEVPSIIHGSFFQTHPTSPERLILAQKAADDIEQQVKDGKPFEVFW